MAKIKWLLFVFILCCHIVNAQVEKIDTDRPDQTESAFTVPAGWLQGELGFVKERNNSVFHPLNIWTLPTLLTRLGLSKRLELRLITEYERWGDEHRLYEDTIGFLAPQLGIKVNLVKAKGLIPQISLIAHTGFNSLGSRFTNRHGSFFSPNFRFTLQNSITDDFAIGYNFGAEWEDTHEPPVWLYTFAPGFNLGEKWYAYIEAFGFFYKDYAPSHSLDGGIAYYINDNLKADVSAGIGLSENAPDNYVSVGLSWRFKIKKQKD